MTRFHLSRLLAGTGGTLLTSAVGDSLFTGVSTDSRTVRPGEVFFALRGPRHDGADHLRDAWEKGGAAAVVPLSLSADPARIPPIPLVAVPDPLAALQSFAAAWRASHAVTAVAVTGSVGKTTTKDMTAALLSLAAPTAKTEGNLNNHIGLPLTLLGIDDHHRFAVLEMGASAPGEIARLAALARPDAAVITRLGWAHLGGFGGHEALVAEKGSVLELLPAEGWCALPFDDPAFPVLSSRARCRVVAYGIGGGEVRAEGIETGESTSFTLVTPAGNARVTLRGFGRHFVENALAAVAAALPAHVAPDEAAAALSAWEPAQRRGGVIAAGTEVRFIDDTYNANPLSMEVALQTLAAVRERGVTVAVLGGMAELGEWAREGHLAVGETAARLCIDYLVGVGPEAGLYAEGARRGGMAPGRILEFPDHEAARAGVLPLLVPGAWVLFKGSRAAGMEELMNGLLRAVKGR
jgi:UDP-N-acetylmuramoyl-tripeptide--D-alanyl-D-alanine ligase